MEDTSTGHCCCCKKVADFDFKRLKRFAMDELTEFKTQELCTFRIKWGAVLLSIIEFWPHKFGVGPTVSNSPPSIEQYILTEECKGWEIETTNTNQMLPVKVTEVPTYPEVGTKLVMDVASTSRIMLTLNIIDENSVAISRTVLKPLLCLITLNFFIFLPLSADELEPIQCQILSKINYTNALETNSFLVNEDTH